MKIINYVSTHKTSNYDSVSPYSPLNKDGINYDIIRYIDTVNSNNVFVDCPVWSHKAKRTFLIRSPIDVEFSFVVDENNFFINYPEKNQIPLNELLFLGTTKEKTWIGDGNPTIQINIPTYVFWTKNKNIWIEIRPHPQTAVKNNYISVGGWWNISNWVRPTSFGMQVVDNKKPVKISRGDVIFEICFHSDDKNDDFKLIKQEEIPVNIMKKIGENTSLKNFISNISSKFLFTKQKESKCPFAFLFNK